VGQASVQSHPVTGRITQKLKSILLRQFLLYRNERKSGGEGRQK
jgi:hypothetical protein